LRVLHNAIDVRPRSSSEYYAARYSLDILRRVAQKTESPLVYTGNRFQLEFASRRLAVLDRAVVRSALKKLQLIK